MEKIITVYENSYKILFKIINIHLENLKGMFQKIFETFLALLIIYSKEYFIKFKYQYFISLAFFIYKKLFMFITH